VWTGTLFADPRVLPPLAPLHYPRLMTPALDYGLLDRAGADSIAFYPRSERSLPPAGATDYAFEVEPGVSIHARLYVAGRDLPTLLSRQR
jgi:hypothetical protein